jgi:hypothetical protein|tara:strand:+ start:199 stop:390 length:192 start_codon:yes stop_codon:yes gene_type:complete
MRDNSLFGFRSQSGLGSGVAQDFSYDTGSGVTDYSGQGATAAVQAFQQGGVNALLAFLANFQG